MSKGEVVATLAKYAITLALTYWLMTAEDSDSMPLRLKWYHWAMTKCYKRAEKYGLLGMKYEQAYHDEMELYRG